MSNRVALVTGSATGLGVKSVLALAKQGYHLVINYRHSKDKATQLQKRIASYGIKSLCLQGDVSRKEDCLRLIQKTIEYFGRLDILIHNAGPYIFERKSMVEYTDEEWERVISGNLSAVFYLTRASIPWMRQQKWGRIITFGFNQANQASGWINRSAFAAAKVGLVSLTKTLAQEESPYGITVNMVCPGDITGTHKEQSIAEVQQDSTGVSAPIGRPGSGEDIARVIAFLCADESDFITGSIIDISGGQDVLRKRDGILS